MTVGDLVRLYESIDSFAAARQQQQKQSQSLRPRPSTPTRMKLSLQTMFHPAREGRRSRISPRTPQTPSSQSCSPNRPILGRATPADHRSSYQSFSSFSSSTASPASSRTPSRRLRRLPSAVDLALEEERFAQGPEHLGLGLLEPRPSSFSPLAASPFEPSSPFGGAIYRQHRDSAMLDGILEVLEGA